MIRGSKGGRDQGVNGTLPLNCLPLCSWGESGSPSVSERGQFISLHPLSLANTGGCEDLD
jgi:hypothetical protein